MTDWRAALEALPVVAYAIYDDACFAWLNAEARRVLGGGADCLVGCHFTERVHPDDREGASQRFKRLASGSIKAYRADVRFLDGKDRPVWFRVSAHRLAPNEATDRPLTLAIAQTIGESEAEHAVLERSERQLRLALEASNAGTWDWHLASDVVEYSQSFIDLLRYSGRDFHADFVFRERLHPEDRDRAIAAVQRSIAEDTAFDETYRLLCFDGRYRWFHGRGRAVRDASGRARHFPGVLLDWDLQHAARSALERTGRRLRYYAEHDALTGLTNRWAWQKSLATRIRDAAAGTPGFAVLLIDLDQFKDVNDTLGHAIGDRLLVEIAQRMRKLAGAETLIARLGGDEFICLVDGGQPRVDAERLARDLLAEIARPWSPRAGSELAVGASIGIALYPQHARSAEDLLTAADAALYEAKASGRGKYCFFSQRLREQAQRRLQLETRLRRMIDTKAFEIAYQPIRRMSDNRIVAAEALLRWNDEVLDRVSPEVFIPVAENIGLMSVLGSRMREQAFAALAAWRAAADVDFKLALNVSGRELMASDFVADFAAQLARHGLPTEAVTVEITENVLIDSASPARGHAEQLRALGVGLSIDDFGQGYSSLALLKRMRAQEIKIDRHFTDGVDIPGEDDYPIVAAVVSMAHRLGIRVVAEGVERDSQRRLLAALGCEAYQGFIAGGAPVGAAALELQLLNQAAFDPGED